MSDGFSEYDLRLQALQLLAQLIPNPSLRRRILSIIPMLSAGSA